MGLHDCGGPQPLLLQYIYQELGAGHAGECVGCSVIDGCDKDMIVLEAHPHHTLLASFGKDTAETEEDINNTHMWCEVQGHCLLSFNWP